MIFFSCMQEPDERESRKEKRKEKRNEFMRRLEKSQNVQEISTWAIKNNYKKKQIKLYFKFYECAQLIKHTKHMSNMTNSIKWNKWQTYLLQHIQYTIYPVTYTDIFVVLNPNNSDQNFFASHFSHINNLLDTIIFEDTLSSELIHKLQNKPYTKNILFIVNVYTTLSNSLYQAINLTRDLKLLVNIIIMTHKALNWKYFDTKRLKIMLIENERFTIRNYNDHITYINTNINKYYN